MKLKTADHKPGDLVPAGMQAAEFLCVAWCRGSSGEPFKAAVWRMWCARCGEPFIQMVSVNVREFYPNRRCHVHIKPGARVASVHPDATYRVQLEQRNQVRP